MIRNFNYLREYGLMGALLLLCLVFGILNPVFISYANIINVFNQATIIGVIAFGMTLVILIGGIDLSVGSIVAFSGIILALLLSIGFPVFPSILVCLLSGFSIGFINGYLISYGKVPAFIATLGLMSAARGAALFISNGRAISGFTGTFSKISDLQILSIPVYVLVFFGLFILFFIFLKYTYWGHYIYAIGGNEKAAWLSGIKVKKYKLFIYSISGFTAAISSIILVSKLNSAQPQAGYMYELDAIAAVVIGGTSLSGGKGSIRGTLIGALILAAIKNGLSILNVASYYQQILIGIIIIIAVLIDKFSIKNKNHEKSENII